ncbi:hypothetical protein D3C73_1141870 [compost metagenome]
MDAVVQGFQFSGFVDHVFRGRHLATVMQPGGDVQRLPLIVRGLIAAKGRVLAGGRGLGEHQRQGRDSLAMATGVGALGIDRAGQQFDEGVQQLFLPGLQALAFDTHGGRTGYRLQERDAVGTQFVQVALVAAVGQQKHQQADGFVVAIVQTDADQVNPGTSHGQQDFLQIPRLFEAQVSDDVIGPRQLLQPSGAAGVLKPVGAKVE